MSKTLKKLMKKLVSSDTQEQIAVADAKLGNLIKVRKEKGYFSSGKGLGGLTSKAVSVNCHP